MAKAMKAKVKDIPKFYQTGVLRFKYGFSTLIELIIFMTMMSQQKSCLPTEPIIIDKPAPPIEVIYRTFAIDPVTGKRTLISESNDPSEHN